MITLSGLFYFVGLAVAMLYLNMVLLGRRHWAGGEASSRHWLHSVVRFVAVVLALFSFTVLLEQSGIRQDASAEQLHTLSSESTDLIKNMPADRPVLVQVYYSPEVPREYVEAKADLLGLLKEYEARSGGKIRLNLVPTELYLDRGARGGEAVRDRAAPGVFRRPGQADVVRGLPGRRVHLGRRGSRHPVLRPRPAGRVRADALDPRRVQERPQEGRHPDHRRQADGRDGHEDVQPDAGMVDRHRAQEAIRRQLGLARHADLVRPERALGGPAVVAHPETDRQPDRLHQEGRRRPCSSSTRSRPTIPQMSPELPKMPPGGPFGGGQPPEPKGDLRPLLDLVGLDWPSTEIVWNVYNPHPKLADLQSTPEIVFIGKGSGAADAFNDDQSASAGLQEIVTLFPGMLRPKAGSGHRVHPALADRHDRRHDRLERAGPAGLHGHQRNQPPPPPYPHRHELHAGRPAHRPAPGRHQGRQDQGRREEERRKARAAPAKINVIAIADLDLIGEQFFEMRRRKIEDLEFDNVPFVLNCVDVLAGDESFVGLRRKRPLHRRLDVIEQQVKSFDKELAQKTKEAEDQASDELLQAQQGFRQGSRRRAETAPSGTSGPRRSSSPTSSRSPSGGSTSRSRSSKTRS